MTCQLSRISTLSHVIFEKLDFSRNLTHFRILKKLPLISRILVKKFPWWKNLSPIFRSREKCFPDFPVFGKKIPRFSDFWKKDSPIFQKSFPNFLFWKMGKPGYDFGFRFEIFISPKIDISSWPVCQNDNVENLYIKLKAKTTN